MWRCPFDDIAMVTHVQNIDQGMETGALDVKNPLIRLWLINMKREHISAYKKAFYMQVQQPTSVSTSAR